MSKNFDTRTYFDPGCITFTMIPNYKLLHEFELTWSFYIVVDLHYKPEIQSMPNDRIRQKFYPFQMTYRIRRKSHPCQNNTRLRQKFNPYFFILMLLHKFKFNRNELPEPFWVYFTENYTIHSHNTRQIKNFHLGRKNTTLGQRSIKFKGGKLWNDIPSTIKLFRNKILSKENLNFI